MLFFYYQIYNFLRVISVLMAMINQNATKNTFARKNTKDIQNKNKSTGHISFYEPFFKEPNIHKNPLKKLTKGPKKLLNAKQSRAALAEQTQVAMVDRY